VGAADQLDTGQTWGHVKSYVCIEVLSGERPVLYVTRPDGDWCFLCGGDHPDDASAYRVVGAGHVLGSDPTLAAVLDLEPFQEAEREVVGGLWVRTSFEPEG
jgi:hypothetical protein